ncbi:MAG: VWA domain-containing protein [Acidobacteriota bacterium]|nr:VWA domain-containing protein [Acidobacteriota bacterium]
MKRIAALLLFVLGVALVAVSAQSGRTSRPRVVPQGSPQTQNQNQTQAPTSTAPPAQKNDSEPNIAPAAKERVVNDDDEILTVETNLVTIPVSVFDRNGRYLPGLQQTDFKIFEDGKEQQIAYFGTSEQPVTVILVLDTSPSTEYKIEEIQDAAISFVNQLKPNDKVMVIEFDANLNVLSDLTTDKYRLARAIRKADFGDGTSLYDTVDNIINRRLSKIEGRKAVVLFTDGVDTTSSYADFYGTLRAAEESEAPFYTVYYNTYADNRYGGGGGVMTSPYPPIFGGGIPFPFPGGGTIRRSPRGTSARDYEHGKRYLEELTQKSGGRMFSTETNTSLEDAFSGIAEELRRQYNIGYYPSDPGQTGQRRQIKVRINRPSAIVKARDSYIVGDNSSTQPAPQNNPTANAPRKTED